MQIADDLDPRVLVDMDRFLPPGAKERCDFLLVSNRDNWVVPLELKKGKMHARKTLRQLQAGARVADTLIPIKRRTKFRPVMASGEIHRSELNLLKKQKVSFRGQEATVARVRCGGDLSRDILGRALPA